MTRSSSTTDGRLGPVLHESALLRTVFLTVGAVGVAAYLYRELVAPHVVPVYDYTVSSVRRLTADEVIGNLRPAIEPWIYMGGPPATNRKLGRGFRQLGVPASRIRWEHFDAR